MKIRKLRLKWEQQTESIEGFDPYRWDSRYVSTADDSIWHLFDTCKDFDKTGKVRKLKRYESFGKPLCENCKSLHKLRKTLRMRIKSKIKNEDMSWKMGQQHR